MNSIKKYREILKEAYSNIWKAHEAGKDIDIHDARFSSKRNELRRLNKKNVVNDAFIN